MNKTILNIQIKYEKMGKSEKKIADFILANPQAIIPLSITELADAAESSEATIVRFARRLGFSGYQALKISVAQESGQNLTNPDILPTDSCFEIFEKLSDDIYRSLEMTKSSLNSKTLELAAQKILTAGAVYIFGLGNSSAVALDAAHKFMRAGCNAFAYSDNHMQAIAASHMKKGDVALGISHSGSSRDIVEALQIAKKNEAFTISITNHGKSPIVKASDISLYTSSKETQYSILGLNSRIAALAIIDSIYAYIVNHMGEDAARAINNVENALKTKKY